MTLLINLVLLGSPWKALTCWHIWVDELESERVHSHVGTRAGMRKNKEIFFSFRQEWKWEKYAFLVVLLFPALTHSLTRGTHVPERRTSEGKREEKSREKTDGKKTEGRKEGLPAYFPARVLFSHARTHTHDLRCISLSPSFPLFYAPVDIANGW